MNYEALAFWWSVLNTAGICLLGVINWWQKRSAATAADIREQRVWMEKEIDETSAWHQHLSERVSRIETELRHVPSRSEIMELVEKMSETQSKLSNAVGELAALNRQMRLVQEHLLSRREA